MFFNSTGSCSWEREQQRLLWFATDLFKGKQVNFPAKNQNNNIGQWYFHIIQIELHPSSPRHSIGRARSLQAMGLLCCWERRYEYLARMTKYDIKKLWISIDIIVTTMTLSWHVFFRILWHNLNIADSRWYSRIWGSGGGCQCWLSCQKPRHTSCCDWLKLPQPPPPHTLTDSSPLVPPDCYTWKFEFVGTPTSPAPMPPMGHPYPMRHPYPHPPQCGGVGMGG